jgi:hypothetical protein
MVPRVLDANSRKSWADQSSAEVGRTPRKSKHKEVVLDCAEGRKSHGAIGGNSRTFAKIRV